MRRDSDSLSECLVFGINVCLLVLIINVIGLENRQFGCSFYPVISVFGLGIKPLVVLMSALYVLNTYS